MPHLMMTEACKLPNVDSVRATADTTQELNAPECAVVFQIAIVNYQDESCCGRIKANNRMQGMVLLRP